MAAAGELAFEPTAGELAAGELTPGEPKAGELKAGPERSLVCALLGLPLLALESADFLRSRAGVAGFGTLVEVVNEGGAGSGPSKLMGLMGALKLTGSLSTTLGG